MSKYTSITISGPVASGTTTAAQHIAETLSLKYQSAGDFFRKYMIDHGVELHKKEDLPDKLDRKFDEEIERVLKSKKPIVLDGLYVGYFARKLPHVFKVLLTADKSVRVKRALTRTHTHKETEETVLKRDKSHDLKFRKLYADENFLDPKFFDLVIDTTDLSVEDVNIKILKKFREN